MVDQDCAQINLPGEIIRARQPLLIALAGSQLEPIADRLRKRGLAFEKKHLRNPEGVVFESSNCKREWSNAVSKAKL
jgi:hypothetical protein